MLSLIAVLLCAGALASSLRPIYDLEYSEELFEDFKIQYNKTYSNAKEEKIRYGVFIKNLVDANRRNSDPSEHAEFGVTQFSDLTTEEFISTFVGLIKPETLDVGTRLELLPTVTGSDAPAAFDWRSKNVVTKVKNQRRCGSCWAFSATGSIEGQYAIKHGKLLSLSEQQLVSCDKESNGCGGGLMENAMKYLEQAGGIETESDYPYTANDGQCSFDKSKVAVKLTSYKHYNLKNENEENLKEFLFKKGPLSIAVDASSWKSYRKGIITDCPLIQLNHGVLLVAYGEDSGVKYWTIKNSWGEEYGENGYIRIKRGVDACGLMNDMAVLPTVA